MSEYLCILTGYVCWVCGGEITDEDPHTYHAEGCRLRDPEVAACIRAHPCSELSGCGEDVHETCCPTCTGQAF